jgi:hypothetical protein
MLASGTLRESASIQKEFLGSKIDRKIDVTSFQPPCLIRWCTCTSKPFAIYMVVGRHLCICTLVSRSGHGHRKLSDIHIRGVVFADTVQYIV